METLVLEKPILQPPNNYLNSPKSVSSGGYKLFYFKPRTYGQEAFVLAESLQKAKDYLIATKKVILDDISKWNSESHNELIDEMTNETNGYSVEEHNIGSVVFSEIA